MDLAQMVFDNIGKDKILDVFSETLGEDKAKVTRATDTLLPALLGGMNQNIQNKEGLSSLMEAIGEHSNAKVSNPKNFLENLDLKDGEKILGHLLGNNKSKVQKEVSKASGLSNISTGKLMMMLAPLIMGFLGNKSKKDKGFDSGSLVKMLAGVGASSLLSSLLKDVVNPASSQTNKKDDSNVVKDIFKKILK